MQIQTAKKNTLKRLKCPARDWTLTHAGRGGKPYSHFGKQAGRLSTREGSVISTQRLAPERAVTAKN